MSNFDAALERFQQIDLEYAGGLANHGPMGAEALEALGHQAKIPAFVDIYAPRLPPMSMGSALAPADRMAARGDISRVGDWIFAPHWLLSAVRAEGALVHRQEANGLLSLCVYLLQFSNQLGVLFDKN